MRFVAIGRLQAHKLIEMGLWDAGLRKVGKASVMLRKHAVISETGSAAADCQILFIRVCNGFIGSLLCFVGAAHCAANIAVTAAFSLQLVSLGILCISHILALMCLTGGKFRFLVCLCTAALSGTGSIFAKLPRTAQNAARTTQGSLRSPHSPAGHHGTHTAFLLNGGHTGVAGQNTGNHTAGL